MKSEPNFYWHWQSLSSHRFPVEGRAWWHIGEKEVRFSWNLWTSFFGLSMSFTDEGITLHAAVPPVAFWLGFGGRWKLIYRLMPKRPSTIDPSVMLVDERRCEVAIHGGRLWISPWARRHEWNSKDPWYVRGLSFRVNPFEMIHQKHEVRRPDGSWVPYSPDYEPNAVPDGREVTTHPYRYTLRNGKVQERIATVYVDRREWRPWCLQWTPLFRRVSTGIKVTFNDEVGDRSGSWKGGVLGCGYTMLPGESAAQCLRRMESERKFD